MPDAATEIAVSRTFPAPRDQVFAAWTDPEQITQWWGPTDFAVPSDSVNIDLRPGGRYDLTMVDPSGNEYPVRQEILEVDPPSMLVLRHEPMPAHGLNDPIDTRVEFHDEGNATRVEITSGPYNAEMGPNASIGWEQQFDKLERLLSA
jgi:uncharacterized protein YndB with AHSA1/START domain